MTLVIRRATPDDVAALAPLVRPVPGAALPPLDAAYVAGHPVYGGWEGERAVGLYALEPAEGEPWTLRHLWVVPEWSRRGRGRWLLTDAMRRARLGGAGTIRLRPEPGAEAFFVRMGAHPLPGAPGVVEFPAGWREPLPESVSELGWSE